MQQSGLLQWIEFICQSQRTLSELIFEPGQPLHYICHDKMGVSDYVATETDLSILLSFVKSKKLESWPLEQNHSFAIGERRFRVNFAIAQGRPRAVLRLLKDHVPTAEELRIPTAVVSQAMGSPDGGIILVCGKTGHGKSTSLAALIKKRAERGEHILTVEDPIEYPLPGNMPMQFYRREVGEGKDVPSFATALESIMRQAAKVVMVGEIRDPASAVTALNAAGTGHLIFTTLHTGRVADSVSSLLKLIPGDRLALAMEQFPTVLRAVVCQRLVPDGKGGRFAIHEVLMPSIAVGNRIRKGDFAGLNTEIEQGQSFGNQSFKRSLELAEKERIIDAKQLNYLTTNFL